MMVARETWANTLVVIALGLAAASASADALGHRWVEVDNSTDINGDPTGLDDGTFDGTIYRTFDLFIEVDTPVVVLDSGISPTAAPNDGLNLDAASTYFQFAPLGDNIFPPTAGALAVFPRLEFDSFVGMGDLTASELSTAGVLTFSTTLLRGTWFADGGLSAAPNANGEIFAGRFTVSSTLGFGTDESSTRSLAGELLVSFNDETSQIIMISNAYATVPCPGDLDDSDGVDAADLGLLLQAWDPVGPTDSAADLNGDGRVDGADLGLLLQGWGACP